MAAAIGVIMNYVYGPLSDFLIERQYLSRLATRKLFEAYCKFVCLCYTCSDISYKILF